MNARGGLQTPWARWQAWPARHHRAIVRALVLALTLTLVWTSLLPAWRLLREGPQQQRQLEARWTRMRWLADQARSLRTLPRSTPEEARQALLATTREQLGGRARVQVEGQEAVVTLAGAPPEVLELWLAQVRSQARVLPTQARLQRNDQGLWEGAVRFGLPAS